MIHAMAKCDFNTDWSVDQLLAALPGFQRVDDGADLLAFILRGRVPGHAAYIYLFGQGRRTISYDQEDWARDTGEWDHAVERGRVTAIEELAQVCRRWLDGEA